MSTSLQWLEWLASCRSVAIFDGVVEGKIYRKPWIFPWNMGCSCNLSLKPINWNIEGHLSIHRFKHAQLLLITRVSPLSLRKRSTQIPKRLVSPMWMCWTLAISRLRVVFQTLPKCPIPSVSANNQYYRRSFGVPCGNHMIAMGDSIPMEIWMGKPFTLR